MINNTKTVKMKINLRIIKGGNKQLLIVFWDFFYQNAWNDGIRINKYKSYIYMREFVIFDIFVINIMITVIVLADFPINIALYLYIFILKYQKIILCCFYKPVYFTQYW